MDLNNFVRSLNVMQRAAIDVEHLANIAADITYISGALDQLIFSTFGQLDLLSDVPLAAQVEVTLL